MFYEIRAATVNPWPSDIPGIGSSVAVEAKTPLATATILPRPGFTDADGAAFEVGIVQTGYGLPARTAVAHLNKTKPPRLSRITISQNRHAFDSSVLCKQRSNGVFRCGVAEIPYEDFVHGAFLLNLQTS